MAKRGRPRKVVENGNGATAIQENPTVPLSHNAYDLVLGIRRIRHGNFSGLWELTELSVDPNGVAVFRVLTDANTKSLVVAAAAKRLSRCI